MRAACILLAACAAGGSALGARLDAARGGPEASLEVTLDAIVAEGVRRPAGRFRVDLRRAVAVAPADVEVPERLRLYGEPGGRDGGGLADVPPGTAVRLRARLRRPTPPRNPGVADAGRGLRRQGIGAVGGLVHPALWVRRGPEVRTVRWHGARARAAARMAAAGPGGPLLAALSLGERSALAPGVREAFARLGLAHLLAVSGLHLTLVAGMGYALGRAALARWAAFAARRDARRAALWVAVGLATLHALASGFAVPVRRALVLVVTAAAGLASGRPRRRAHPLCAAALWILARDPAALFAPGAQLSFAATAALLAAASPSARDPGPYRGSERGSGLARLCALVAGGLRTSATALLATTPLVAWHWGRLEPAGLLANLLAVPWTAAVLLPAAGVAAAVSLAPAGPVPDALLWACERAARASLGAVEAAAAHAPSLPASGPTPVWALLAVLALVAWALRQPSLGARMAGLAAVTALLALAPPPAVAPPPPRVVFLDVGQGDATLVQGRRGAVLVDAGGALPGGADRGRDIVVPALRALGVRRLDRLVVTHADLDHRGGAPAVLEGIPVNAVWLPPGGARDVAFDALRAAAAAHGAAVLERAAGAPAERVGDLRLEVLWPPRAAAGRSRNEGSLVLRVEVAGRRVLLPGDVEREAEGRLVAGGADLGADLLKLAHHGSASSSSAAFLAAVAPGLAVASAPCGGRWHMPHPDLARRLARDGVRLLWTGRDGAVLVGLRPRVSVRTWGVPHRGCTGGAGPSGRNRSDLAAPRPQTR